MTCYSDHHSVFHHRLYDLRQRAVFTDVKVTSDQKSFECHKVVLSAVSPYFETMLQTNMLETETGEIKLPFNDDTVESVLDYIYIGDNFLTPPTVLHVYQAAHMLQISPLITMCEDYLRTELSKENCLGIWKMAKLLERTDMEGVAKVLVSQKFTEICSVDVFDQADLTIEELKILLRDPFLNCTPPDKCSATVIWLSLQEDISKESILNLFLFLVTECGISVEDLKQNLHEDNTGLWNSLPPDTETPTRREIYQEVARQLSTEIQPKKSMGSRQDEGLIIIGGNDMKSRTFTMTLNLRDHKWYALKQLPEDPGYYFAVCGSGENLYLTGGSIRNKQFLQYDIRENAWTRLSNLPVGRESHGMVGFDYAIYLFGGKTDPSACASYVEMYIQEDRSWRKVGEMAKPVLSPSYCVMNDRIYIFGGSLSGATAPSDLAQCYDTRNNLSWNLDFKLPFKSKSPTLMAVAGTREIYLIYKGDVYTLDPTKRPVKAFSLLSGPQKHAGAINYGDKFLFIGGEDDNYSTLNTIVLFDPATKDATPLPNKTPWPLKDFKYAKIKMPSALVHALREVRSSDGALPAIGF